MLKKLFIFWASFKSKALSLLIIYLLYFILLPTPAFAQEVINSFDVEILAKKDGKMVITEGIEYDFGSENRHGIFRFIPTVSKVGDLYRVIKIDFKEIMKDGESEEHEVDRESKQVSLKIGDPDKTISGPHIYRIVYEVENGIGSNYEDHDEIYWDVTGDEWNVPINKSSVKFETDFGLLPDKYKCFTGESGSKLEDCTVSGNIISTNALLNSYQGFTVVANFPVNTFPKSILQKDEPFADPDLISFLKVYSVVWALLNFLLAPYLLYWYFKNKSKLRFGSPTVNFDLPKDEKKRTVYPAEAGIIDNTKLERDDVVATIFDMAIRKYLKIEEIKKVKTLRPDEIDYKFVKLKEYDGPNKFEAELLARLFKDNKEVSLKDLKKDFYVTFQKLEEEVFDSLVKRGFYIKNPKTQMGTLLVFGIIAFVTANIILGPVLIYLSRKLNGRTQTGDKVDWQVDGLKIFLKSMSKRHYKWQAKNLITVEKYIPYAMALGMIDEFMEELKVIYPNYQPNWYSGSGNFYGHYSGMYGSMSSNITTSAQSSSSGFSGGGSSGGGGGGGGGGSW